MGNWVHDGGRFQSLSSLSSLKEMYHIWPRYACKDQTLNWTKLVSSNSRQCKLLSVELWVGWEVGGKCWNNDKLTAITEQFTDCCIVNRSQPAAVFKGLKLGLNCWSPERCEVVAPVWSSTIFSINSRHLAMIDRAGWNYISAKHGRSPCLKEKYSRNLFLNMYVVFYKSSD